MGKKWQLKFHHQEYIGAAVGRSNAGFSYFIWKCASNAAQVRPKKWPRVICRLLTKIGTPYINSENIWTCRWSNASGSVWNKGRGGGGGGGGGVPTSIRSNVIVAPTFGSLQKHWKINKDGRQGIPSLAKLEYEDLFWRRKLPTFVYHYMWRYMTNVYTCR